jgi:23S rRNA (adenine2503-C2)-methyltransferase
MISDLPILATRTAIDVHDFDGLEEVRRRLVIDRHDLKQFRNALYKEQRSDAEALSMLPAGQRSAFASQVALHSLQLHSRHDSRRDGASKLIFRTRQGLLLEAVILRIATGRTTLCVSSQVGCAARCGFCATGKMGIAHNLSTSEILDQVVQANQLLVGEGRRLRNIVFMGMGEPFHNEEGVCQALEVLGDARCFNLSHRHLLVSTVGIPAAMVRFAKRFPKAGLALSLHSVRPGIRERLLPISRHYSLADLHDALTVAAAIQPLPVMIEYVMMNGLTDTAEDLDALTGYLRGLRVHINLIPYNPIEDTPELVGSDLPRCREFAIALRAASFPATVRYSLGSDIAAACGQLVRRENPRVLSSV